MTRLEGNRRIDYLISKHKKTKERIVQLDSLVDHYTLVWMRLIEKLDAIAPNSEYPIDMSQYPSTDQVQALYGELRYRKWQLEWVTAELKKAGMELK